ncbi:MAG TPA: alpha/beta hydrolase [Solirubrobacterales bacterium]|nr:alpha/beta hydrolase [Solirubrobacterales bacterium]
MASIPRLPPAVEHHVLRFACHLRPSLQRRLFGPPPVLDGQQLAPDIHTLISIAARARSDSLASGTDPAEARAQRLAEARIVAERPTIPMARVVPVEIPGPAGAIPARLYVPRPAEEGPQPLLVYYHGGGWVIGDLDTHDSPCRFLAAHAGVAVLAIDYRLAPEHPFPAAVEDACAAYGWASENAGSLGVDPTRIAVGGDSAGGNLAAVVCLQARDEGAPAPAMQLLIYPVADTGRELPSRRAFAEGFLLTRRDMAYYEDRYLPPGSDRNDPRVAVLQADDLAGLPPAYVATAGFDRLRDEGEAYARRLREAGVRVALRRHRGLVHSFVNFTAICPSSRSAVLEACGALRMGLAPGAP